MRKPVVIGLVTVLVLAIAGVVGWQGYQWLVKRYTPEVCSVRLDDGSTTTLSAEQARNAAIIVAASIKEGLPERAAIVAIATAYQESALRNLDYGDRDSLGLFQQRPSYGWGTEAQIMDPWYASHRFYEEIVKFTNWESVDVNDMAQKVQRSGHPQAYRKHEAKAVAVAGALRGTRPATLACLDLDPPGAPNPEAFKRTLATLGQQITQTWDGQSRLTIAARDETALWSAAHLVVAATYDGGVSSVVVGDRQWSRDRQEWRPAKDPVDARTVVVTLG